jgi:hypothetical protein
MGHAGAQRVPPRGGAIRHFWGSKLLYVPSEPGQEYRHNDALDPLWNMLNLVPEGRGELVSSATELRLAAACPARYRPLLRRRLFLAHDGLVRRPVLNYAFFRICVAARAVRGVGRRRLGCFHRGGNTRKGTNRNHHQGRGELHSSQTGGGALCSRMNGARTDFHTLYLSSSQSKSRLTLKISPAICQRYQSRHPACSGKYRPRLAPPSADA